MSRGSGVPACPGTRPSEHVVGVGEEAEAEAGARRHTPPRVRPQPGARRGRESVGAAPSWADRGPTACPWRPITGSSSSCCQDKPSVPTAADDASLLLRPACRSNPDASFGTSPGREGRPRLRSVAPSASRTTLLASSLHRIS
ncbi:uncharacterized protein LOC103652329 [Zea mays]|uniref:uncharacterized protein LOC103652329 n=1 Tax=Zea mays TaxID=4577 RepID=UPI000221BBA9|nr:uncharacterized protein LOC103652329 [Zea mays]